MSCIHIYFGEQRKGKTLYMVLQAQLVAYDKARLNNCYQRIDAYTYCRKISLISDTG